MAEPPAEVSERLLTAWRGEILAGAVYGLIARRLAPREADILRRMAEAESGHRRRLEERMTQLGIVIPDPAAIKVPLWLRLQAPPPRHLDRGRIRDDDPERGPAL